jgi:hypothetical protein
MCGFFIGRYNDAFEVTSTMNEERTLKYPFKIRKIDNAYKNAACCRSTLSLVNTKGTALQLPASFSHVYIPPH